MYYNMCLSEKIELVATKHVSLGEKIFASKMNRQENVDVVFSLGNKTEDDDDTSKITLIYLLIIFTDH